MRTVKNKFNENWNFNEYLLLGWSESHISLTFQWFMTSTPYNQQIYVFFYQCRVRGGGGREWMLKVSLFPAYAPSYACQPDLSSNIAHIQYVCITCTIRRTVIIHMYCTLCIMYTYYRSYLHILYSTLHNATAGQSGYQSAWTRQWPKCIRWHVKIPKTGWMKGDAEKQFSEIPDIYSYFSEHDTFISQLF